MTLTKHTHKLKTMEEKSYFGALEIDRIFGKNHHLSLLLIVDRKTGYLWLKSQ